MNWHLSTDEKITEQDQRFQKAMFLLLYQTPYLTLNVHVQNEIVSMFNSYLLWKENHLRVRGRPLSLLFFDIVTLPAIELLLPKYVQKKWADLQKRTLKDWEVGYEADEVGKTMEYYGDQRDKWEEYQRGEIEDEEPPQDQFVRVPIFALHAMRLMFDFLKTLPAVRVP